MSSRAGRAATWLAFGMVIVVAGGRASGAAPQQGGGSPEALPAYNIFNLGGTAANDISDNGKYIIGNSSSSTWLITTTNGVPGGAVFYPSTGNNAFTALSINNSGNAAGYMAEHPAPDTCPPPPPNPLNPCVKGQTGAYFPLGGPVQALPARNYTEPNGGATNPNRAYQAWEAKLNNNNELVGFSSCPANPQIRCRRNQNDSFDDPGARFLGTRAFYWKPGDVSLTDAGSLDEWDALFAPNNNGQSNAEVISDSGIIVGTSDLTTNGAPLGFTGHVQSLSRIGGVLYNSFTVPNDVNDSGTVVGQGVVGGQTRAFRSAGAGTPESLGSLGSTSNALGINASGWIVGFSFDGSSQKRATIWEPGASTPIDLNTLPGITALGWVLEEARAIDATGNIVGTGKLNGAQRAFLLVTDLPPAVVHSSPGNGAQAVPPGANIVLDFSEPVNVSAANLVCGAESVPVTISGNGTSRITFDPLGDLPLAGLCTFSLAGANVTDVDAIDPPNTMTELFSITFSVGNPTYSIADTEKDTSSTAIVKATVTVSLSIFLDTTVSVDFATEDSSATAGVDYEAKSGTLFFGADEVTKTIDIDILPAPGPAQDKTFTVRLSNPDGGTIADGTATVTLKSKPKITSVTSSLGGGAHGPSHGFDITIQGEHLQGASLVQFRRPGGAVLESLAPPNGGPTQFTFPAPDMTSEMEAAGVAGDDIATEVAVTLVNNGQSFMPDETPLFTFHLPRITSLSPDHAPYQGGTTVTLTGEFLTGVTEVQFVDEFAAGADSDGSLLRSTVTPDAQDPDHKLTFQVDDLTNVKALPYVRVLARVPVTNGFPRALHSALFPPGNANKLGLDTLTIVAVDPPGGPANGSNITLTITVTGTNAQQIANFNPTKVTLTFAGGTYTSPDPGANPPIPAPVKEPGQGPLEFKVTFAAPDRSALIAELALAGDASARLTADVELQGTVAGETLALTRASAYTFGAPVITSATPAALSGAGGLVTIHGFGFTGASSVQMFDWALKDINAPLVSPTEFTVVNDREARFSVPDLRPISLDLPRAVRVFVDIDPPGTVPVAHLQSPLFPAAPHFTYFNPNSPLCPVLDGAAPRALAQCDSAANDSPSGSVTVTSSAGNGDITATGNGMGGLLVARYDTPPVGTPTFAANGSYFDVRASDPHFFSSITIVHCALEGGQHIEWWDPSAGGGAGAWLPVIPQVSSPPGCITITIDVTSSPSLAQMGGTIFGISMRPRADVNCSGDTTAEDAIAILLALAGLLAAPESCAGAPAFDIDGDSGVTVADAVRLRQILAGLRTA